MGLPARLVRVVLVWAVIVWVCAAAYRWGVADSLVHDALKSMAQWSDSRKTASLEDWLVVRNDLVRAARLSPGDPAVAETLGVLHGQRASTPDFMELAHEHLSGALELRPTSPYSWSSLAVARYGLGKTDLVFEAALVNAIRLGPSEPEVQVTVADLGLATWDSVSSVTRVAVTDAIRAGMRRKPLEILAISERRGRLGPACGFVAGNKRVTDPRWAAVCESREKT